MKDETKRLVEAAEKRANDASSPPWDEKIFSLCCVSNDAHFAAHARSDVPTLCAIIREQDKRIQELEERVKGLQEQRDAWIRRWINHPTD